MASKYEEIDYNLVRIIFLRAYIRNQLYLAKADAKELTPTDDDIIECERSILAHFNYNIGFVLPIHFVRNILANGVVFSNELSSIEANLEPEEF